MVDVIEDRERGHRGWGRFRSGALLVAMLVGIGVGTAATLGVLALAAAAMVDQALG